MTFFNQKTEKGILSRPDPTLGGLQELPMSVKRQRRSAEQRLRSSASARPEEKQREKQRKGDVFGWKVSCLGCQKVVLLDWKI